jgi:D-serine dehydratase
VAAAVGRVQHLRLAGVEAWEGAVGHDREDETLARVDALLDRAVALARELDDAGAFAGCDEVVLSAGGSTFFDRVADRLRVPDGGLSRPVRTLLRSGCYLTHDHGHYDRLSPLGARLRPALQLWADVRSRPEPGLAILGFGKRDAPYDIDLPRVLALVDREGRRQQPPAGWEVAATNDQHAFLRGEGDGPAVGDVLLLGISHPCTAFDKWNALPLVDQDANVVGAIRTVF